MADTAARHVRAAESVEPLVLEVLRSGRFIGGPMVTACESAIAGRLGMTHGVGVGSGTDALILALMAMNIGVGDEVVLPAVSFWATCSAVLHVGATPVAVDTLADRPLLDPSRAAEACTGRTKAILPVHLFGSRATAPSVPGVTILDDAAQATGSALPILLGALAATSFYPTKVVGAAGDGGMVVTNDPDLAARVRSLGSHGFSAPYVPEAVGRHLGRNSRLDAVQAAVLLGHLESLDEETARRRAIAQSYDDVLGDRAVPRDPGSNVAVYTFRDPRRDAIAVALRDRGIETTTYYPHALTDDLARLRPDLPKHPTPNAHAYCRTCLSLPCHGAMSDADVLQVVGALRACA